MCDNCKSIQSQIHELDKKIIVIETSLTHTLQIKHNEALATARAIDLKFKWISMFVASIASISAIFAITVKFFP